MASVLSNAEYYWYDYGRASDETAMHGTDMRHSGTPPGRSFFRSRRGFDPGRHGGARLGGWTRPGARSRLGAAGFAALVAGCLTGCEAPPEAQFPISERAAALPRPELGETARFGRIAADSAATAQSIDADRATLAARAEALRARAAELSGPIIEDEARDRLRTARDEGIEAPSPPAPSPSSAPDTRAE